MNSSNIRKTSLFLVYTICSLIIISSCKKNENGQSNTNDNKLIVGLWQIQSVTFKFYDTTTGLEKDNPGYVSYNGSGISYRADGTYVGAGGNGTYKYNSSTRVITMKDNSGRVQNSNVTELDYHKLTFETTYISGNTKTIDIRTFSK